ncbi:MAG: cag pathogenicity island protein [Lachnospiraceae bacterium]|nr:cag pathogenicity island protein [Lachnospiraceae bacterium]
MSKYDEKSKEYTMNYIKEKGLEEIRFRVKGEEKERYKTAAESAGLSLAKFFTTAADEKIERDNLTDKKE